MQLASLFVVASYIAIYITTHFLADHVAMHVIVNIIIAGSIYCVQLRSTGQLAQIEQLMQDAKTTSMKQLCTQVINCCEKYKERA